MMGGKKIWGRKRHALVDTQGNLLGVRVLPADIADGDGARVVLPEVAPRLPRLVRIWTDGAYGGVIAWAQERFGWSVEVVGKLAGQVGFVPLPKRWLVETTQSQYP